jgi:hypothetical protein
MIRKFCIVGVALMFSSTPLFQAWYADSACTLLSCNPWGRCRAVTVGACTSLWVTRHGFKFALLCFRGPHVALTLACYHCRGIVPFRLEQCVGGHYIHFVRPTRAVSSIPGPHGTGGYQGAPRAKLLHRRRQACLREYRLQVGIRTFNMIQVHS